MRFERLRISREVSLDLTYSRAKITLGNEWMAGGKTGAQLRAGTRTVLCELHHRRLRLGFLFSAAHLRLPHTRFVRGAHGVGRSVGLQKRSARRCFTTAQAQQRLVQASLHEPS